MSFLRRLALKSVMAAKKESVAKCAGPLHHGVGRPDGADTMIKTTQYLAEADTSRVLVALDLKAAFQNVSRRAMLYSIEQTDADLAAVFSKWYTGTTEHRMHNDSAHTEISANSGVDQGCPLSTCGFSAIDPVLWTALADICRLHVPSAKLFAWTTVVPLQTFTLITTPDQSTLHYSPPRYSGEPLAGTLFHLSFKTRSNSQLSGHQIHGDIESSPVLGEQASTEKTSQRFQRIATTLADHNAAGLNAQAAHHLTHHVRWCSKSARSAHEFLCQNKKLATSTDKSRPFGPTSSNATSPLSCFFLLFKLGGDLVWALQFNAMLLHHGALGSRS